MNGVGGRESNDGTSSLSLGGVAAVHDAVAAARAFGERTGMDEASAVRLAVVVEELVMNLYDHGGLSPDSVFDLEMTSEASEVRLVLIAPGQEFDPTATLPRTATSSRGAGAGLKLVKAWSRKISHRYVDGRNRLELSLPYGRRA
jgi:anti-sigma regulatory factor (Ser/Thr protein kinase)